MLAVLLLAVVPCAYSLGVIVPLYTDPGADCSRWSSTSDAISAHSGTPFYLVINPQSGPGAVGSQPDQSYNNCIPTLRPSSNPNSIVLGYIDIRSKSSSAILAEIDTYAGWSSTSRPTGLFIDGTNASSVTQYQSFISHAKDKAFNFIALDPGEPPSSDYYSLADLVNTYESSYSGFRTADLVISSSAPASKQSVILSTAPMGSYSTIISQIASAGIAAVYITDLPDTQIGIPQQWSAFVNDVAAAGGFSPTPANRITFVSLQTSTTSNTLPNAGSTTSSSRSGISNTSTASSSPTSSAVASSSSHVGPIVGGVLGAVIVIILLVFFILWRRRRQSSRNSPLDPFLSRQPFTLLQPVEKHAMSTLRTASETEAGTLPADVRIMAPSSSSNQTSASPYNGGRGGGASKERLHAAPAASRGATVASNSTTTGAGAAQYLSYDPPPSYHPTPSPHPT